jgi:hypothetical protein
MLRIAAGIILGGLVLFTVVVMFLMWAALEPHDPWRPIVRIAMIASILTGAAIVFSAL